MKIFNIDEKIAFWGKSLVLIDKKLNKKTMVIGDVHIGFEEALNKNGFLVPRTLFKEIYKDLEEALDSVKPDTIIIHGDLKHEFGRISKQEWRDTFKLIELITKKCKDIILLRGNHDKILDPIVEKFKIKVQDDVLVGDVLIIHGNELLKENNQNYEDCKTIVIGHEHPCIVLRDDHKYEKFKTFLVGTFDKKRLIVLPSFNPIDGVDITKEKLLSPFLKKNPNFKDFEVYITADEIYAFGRIEDFMKNKN